MRPSGFGLIGGLLLIASLHADVIDPREEGCRNRRAGDTCRLAASEGRCADRTCTRLDYSRGVPPGSKTVPCLVCEPTFPSRSPAAPGPSPRREAMAAVLAVVVLVGGLVFARWWHGSADGVARRG